MSGTLTGLPVLNRRKVGMTSSPHGLYTQGLTRATMAATTKEAAEVLTIGKDGKRSWEEYLSPIHSQLFFKCYNVSIGRLVSI
jgi:hypothetical protein